MQAHPCVNSEECEICREERDALMKEMQEDDGCDVAKMGFRVKSNLSLEEVKMITTRGQHGRATDSQGVILMYHTCGKTQILVLTVLGIVDCQMTMTKANNE